MKWPPMASPGAEHHNTVFQKYTQHRSSTTSGGHISKTSEGQDTKSRLLVPQVHVKPIWRLEKKPVPPIDNRNTALSKIVPENTFYFFPGQLSTTDSSNPPLRTVFTAALHQSRCSNDPFPGTLIYQQSSRVHRPYQKLESLCLRSTASQRIPLSPNRNLITGSPANSFVSSDSAMSSSYVDQFNPPSAAGEPTNLGLRTSFIRSRKVTNSPNKPALNTNAFLRPNTATVPLYMSQETRKVKNPRMSAGTAPWYHPVSNEDETNCSLDEPLTKSKSVLNPSHLDSSALTTSDRGYDRMDAHMQSKQGNGDDTRGRIETRDQDVRLTEAVRKLTKNGFAKNNFLSDADLGNDTSMSLGFHSAAVNTNCKRKAQSVLHAIQIDEVDCVCSEVNYIGANLSQILANTENAKAFPKLIVASLLKSSSSSGNSDPVPSCRAAGCPPHVSKPSKAMVEDSRVMNVSAVATQISTIQLDKKDIETDVLKDDDVLEEDEFAARDVYLPDNSQGDCNSQIDGIEEELANGLEDCSSMAEDDDDDDDDDDESDSFVARHTSSASMLLISRKCIEDLTQSLETQEKIHKPAFTQSIFPNIQPTIYFGTRNETVEVLPWEQRKLLKWKMSTVTPNVVKQAIARSHFRVTKKNHDWLGCWGHHMKSPAFKTILEHQKLNHFPGSFQIGRKDRLWRNLSKMQARFGRKEFNFFPQTFVLPLDIKLLKKAWEESGTRQKWIVKPPASARGIGIQVIHKWSQLPKRRPLLVQRYLHKPYLISGSKFDLRIYVYVTSFDPLRVYLFTDGLVRFASCKYSSSMKSLSNKFMHLTNYSVNKKNSEYKSNADETACQGHKWALKALWSYLNEKGISSEKIWEKIKDIVIKTIIASEPYVNSLTKMYLRRPYCSHELFGFDIMLDENLKPWILEVNISPSLHSNSLLDMNIKGQMICDLLNLAGFVLPLKEDIAEANISASNSNCSLISHGKKSRLVHELLTEEKMKRAYYLSQKLPDEDFCSSVLDILTPDDVRTLVETEDEFLRCGQFERVFPSPISSRYLRFFEQPRYLNILLNQWEQRFRDQKHRGLELLKSFCLKGFHTGNISDVTSLWSAPRSFSKIDIHLNGFSKTESARPGKILSPKEKCSSEDHYQMQTDHQLSCFTSIHQPDNVNTQQLL